MSNLGKHGKDCITGFEGTIVSEHNYLTGCTQYGLQPWISKDGNLKDTMFFDVNRLTITGEPIKIQTQEDKGCDSRPRP